MKRKLTAKDKKNMTEAEIDAHALSVYYKKLKQAYRQAWMRGSPLRAKALNAVRSKKDGLDVYMCASCQKLFAKSDVDVDHITPVGTDPSSLSELITTIIQSESNLLQILCKPCHKVKTKEDKAQMKARK